MHMFHTPLRGRIAAVAVAAVAAGLALTGCSSSSSESASSEAASSDAPASSAPTRPDYDDAALQAIYDAGEIKVGVCLGAPNWGFRDTTQGGDPAGFDVDVANLIGDFLGVKTTIVEANNDGRIPALQTGAVDVISCTFTVNDERKQQIDFTDAVVLSGNSVLVRQDSDVASLEDLKGVKVGVNKGGTSIAVATANAPDAVQVPLENFAADLAALKAGQVDAVIDTAAVITDAANKDPNLKIAVDGKVGPTAQFALGVAKDKPGLVSALNDFLADFHGKKEGTELFKKWFWEPTYQFEGLEN